MPRTGGAPERSEGNCRGSFGRRQVAGVDCPEPQTVFDAPVSNAAGSVILPIVSPREGLCVRKRCSCPYFRSRLRSHRRLRAASESVRGTAAIDIHGVPRDSTIARTTRRSRNERETMPLGRELRLGTLRDGRAPTRWRWRPPLERTQERRGSETCHAPGSARMRCGSARGNVPRTESTRVATGTIRAGSPAGQRGDGTAVRDAPLTWSYNERCRRVKRKRRDRGFG